ncbi:MAG TPA: AmmeMemoRadiSam system radical SAM enzyme, partial [Spirochaetia bacterium]|nr:AmmeMemoRadiSam system radical SAM enzyme [Spirochaetia bacterium]
MTVETPGAGGAPGVVRADWWHRLDGRRFQCDLCPRECRLAPGQRGLCYLRFAGSDGLYLSGYGRSSGIAVDPVEKKPLFHFLPGSSALSFGTIGCNLVCTNCQNWRISRSRSEGLLTQSARPDELAQRAVELACHSIAFTYNEPIISAEYVIDCARTAHASGVHTIVVTNGYINGEARSRLFAHIDAANVDLKSSDEGFYRNVCRAELQPVLETLRWLHRESAVWLEVTTLLIPGSNDTDDGLLRLCDWIMENLG